MGPRLTVPCPRCGADAPAGLPRNMILLAVTGVPHSPTRIGRGAFSHVESRCSSAHDVHVYYERLYTSPPDETP